MRPRFSVASEADIERKDSRAARAVGWFVEKIMRCGRNGFPDRFYARARPEDVCPHCGRGRVILMEWKDPDDGEVSAQQRHRHTELRAAGVEVHVVDNLEDARRIRGDA